MPIGGLTETARCSRCRARFEARTGETRSAKLARRPLLCPRCTPVAWDEGGWRSWTDGEYAEHVAWLDEHDPGGYVRSGAAADEAALSRGRDDERRRCASCGQLRPDTIMQAGHPICRPCRGLDPVSKPSTPPPGVHYRSAEDEYDDDAELRFWHDDGEPVYGPEPSGVPVEDRSYSTRWWVPGEGRDADALPRTFPFELRAA